MVASCNCRRSDTYLGMPRSTPAQCLQAYSDPLSLSLDCFFRFSSLPWSLNFILGGGRLPHVACRESGLPIWWSMAMLGSLVCRRESSRLVPEEGFLLRSLWGSTQQCWGPGHGRDWTQGLVTELLKAGPSFCLTPSYFDCCLFNPHLLCWDRALMWHQSIGRRTHWVPNIWWTEGNFLLVFYWWQPSDSTSQSFRPPIPKVGWVIVAWFSSQED